MNEVSQMVKCRLSAFIEYKGLTNAAFEKKCGLSNGYIRNFKGNLGVKKLEDILTSFPELNKEWLLFGKGEMLKSDVSQTSKGDNTIQVSGNNVDMRNINQSKGSADDVKRVKELEKRIEELTKDKERLQDLVDKMQAQISKLLEKI